MSTHLAGKAGNVYVANLLLEDCEDIWENGAKGVAAKETTIFKVGTASAKCTLAATPGTQAVAMFETMSNPTFDFTDYTHILCWAYSVPTTVAGDYRISVGTGAGGATPTTYVTLPALTATTWKYCHCTEVVGSEMADTTVGTIIALYTWANGAENDVIYLDDIRAAKNILGINSWSLDYVTDTLETTDFADAGVKSHIVGGSGWSGSFSGSKFGAPLSIGSQYGIELAESATVTQMYLGNAIITAVHPSVVLDGLVVVSYDFQGTGVLSVASA